MRSRAFLAFAVSICASVASVQSDCVEPANPYLILLSGERACVVHRTPIVTREVFWASDDTTLYHFAAEMARVAACNPNGLYPEASLRPSKTFRFRKPGDYCPVCERAMAAAGKRSEAYFKKHGTYPP